MGNRRLTAGTIARTRTREMGLAFAAALIVCIVCIGCTRSSQPIEVDQVGPAMDHFNTTKYDTMEYAAMELTDFGRFEVELAHAAALPQVSAPPPPGAEPPDTEPPADEGVETPRP